MKFDHLATSGHAVLFSLAWLLVADSPQVLAQGQLNSLPDEPFGLTSVDPLEQHVPPQATLELPREIELRIIDDTGDETFSENAETTVLDANSIQNTVDESATLPLIPSGFLRSRWAMSDPQYAKKYAKGAPKTNLPKKIKQASDARFVDDFAGWYLSAGLTSIGDTPAPLGSIELGHTGYHTSYLTNRIGFIAAFNDEDFYVGGETGVRIQTPTRLAPFVGLGLFAGASSTRSPAEHDNVDNDDDGAIDEDGETEFDFDGALAAVYPEVGVHFWWTPRIRLSGFGRYMVTTEGRRADSQYFGASIAILSR